MLFRSPVSLDPSNQHAPRYYRDHATGEPRSAPTGLTSAHCRLSSSRIFSGELRSRCNALCSPPVRCCSHRFGTHRQGRIARCELSSPETLAARFQAPFQRSSQLRAGRRGANDVRLTSRTSGRQLDCRVDTERLEEGPHLGSDGDVGGPAA
jgi:hypothetical protein